MVRPYAAHEGHPVTHGFYWGGRIVFLIGLALAIIFSFVGLTDERTTPWVLLVIAVLGVLVGLLNVTTREVQTFLLAAIAFLITFGTLSSVLTTVTFGWQPIARFFSLLTVFVAPAAAIVAIRALFATEKY